MTGIPSGGHKCDKCGIPVHPFDGGCSVKSPDFCGEGDEEEGSGVRSRRCLRCHAACKCFHTYSRCEHELLVKYYFTKNATRF